MEIFLWILIEIAIKATYFTGGFSTINELPALQDKPYNFSTTQISDNHIKLAVEKQYNYQNKGYDLSVFLDPRVLLTYYPTATSKWE